MIVEEFINILDVEFFAGVPDSLLRSLSSFLNDKYGNDLSNHIIAANEGNAVALGVGYYLATKKVPLIYLENSGLGNVINPICSLLNNKVYGIPTIFVVGYRGEKGKKDEPQHIFSGQITTSLFETMSIPYYVISKKTTNKDIVFIYNTFKEYLKKGKQVAFIIEKDALFYSNSNKKFSDNEIGISEKILNGSNLLDINNIDNENTLVQDQTILFDNDIINREEAIRRIIKHSKDDPVVTTTGNIGRELFSLRKKQNISHDKDFLSMGAMGHASSICLGMAINRSDKKIWCLDGDASLIMHMGAIAVIGSSKLPNLIHIVLNNKAHESSGGMPTVAGKIELTKIAQACGYEYCKSIHNYEALEEELDIISKLNKLCFLEIMCSCSSRDDLQNIDIPPKKSKQLFIKNLNNNKKQKS